MQWNICGYYDCIYVLHLAIVNTLLCYTLLCKSVYASTYVKSNCVETVRILLPIFTESIHSPKFSSSGIKLFSLAKLSHRLYCA